MRYNTCIYNNNIHRVGLVQTAMAVFSRSTAEPPARYHHAAVGFGQSMFVCAGTGSGLSAVPVLESFNVLSTTWQEPRQLRGRSPDSHQCMAVASDGRKAYWFGGGREGLPPLYNNYVNSLYSLDLSSLSCQKVPTNSAESPTPRIGSAMVSYRRKLVIYGGRTSDVSLSDEVFVFDLNTSEL